MDIYYLTVPFRSFAARKEKRTSPSSVLHQEMYVRCWTYTLMTLVYLLILDFYFLRKQGCSYLATLIGGKESFKEKSFPLITALFLKGDKLLFRCVPRFLPTWIHLSRYPPQGYYLAQAATAIIESQGAFCYSLVTSEMSPPIIVSIPVCRKPLPVKSITVVPASPPRDPSSRDSSWTHLWFDSSSALPTVTKSQGVFTASAFRWLLGSGQPCFLE